MKGAIDRYISLHATPAGTGQGLHPSGRTSHHPSTTLGFLRQLQWPHSSGVSQPSMGIQQEIVTVIERKDIVFCWRGELIHSSDQCLREWEEKKMRNKTAPFAATHTSGIMLSCSDSNQMDAFLYSKIPYKHLFSVNVLTLLSQFCSLLTAHFIDHLTTLAKGWCQPDQASVPAYWDTPVTGFMYDSTVSSPDSLEIQWYRIYWEISTKSSVNFSGNS